MKLVPSLKMFFSLKTGINLETDIKHETADPSLKLIY